jgi:hypothetical protein
MVEAGACPVGPYVNGSRGGAERFDRAGKHPAERGGEVAFRPPFDSGRLERGHARDAPFLRGQHADRGSLIPIFPTSTPDG